MAFDILDSILLEHKQYQTLKPDLVRLKEYTIEFLLDNQTWELHNAELAKHAFAWGEFKYSDIAEGRVDIKAVTSNQTGLYVFIVKPATTINDLPKFAMYVGIAGATQSARALEERLLDYYQLSKVKKRDAVERIIYKYYTHLYISFTPLSVTPDILAHAETNLIGLYGTHILGNRDDIPTNLKPQHKAWNV